MRPPVIAPEFQDWHMSDGYLLRGRVWLGRSPTRAVILYLHGIQSHGGWFEGSASRLAQAGLAVLLPDRRGSGRNQIARGHTPSAGRLLADVCELADVLQGRLAGRQALGIELGHPRRDAGG